MEEEPPAGGSQGAGPVSQEAGSPRAAAGAPRPGAGRGGGGPGAAGAFDLLERARRLHAEYLQRLLQGCFLAPELRAVLADAEHLLGLARELRGALAELLEQLPAAEAPAARPREGAASAAWGAGAREQLPAREREPGPAPPGGPETPRLSRAVSAESSEGGPPLLWPGQNLEECVAAAAGKVARLREDFRSGARFLLQALAFSVARGGGAQQVGSLCLRLNFSRFYCEDVRGG